MAKTRKHDPFFIHLWDELANAKILQHEGIARWIEAPAKLQGQFVAAARKAMHAALGAPPKPAKRKAAKKPPAAKSKPKAKARAKPKATRPRLPGAA
jgi:hypothetical protein